METINGYTVIADKADAYGTRVILAVKVSQYTGSGFEYVIARTHKKEDAPTEWHAGDYVNALTEAVEKFHAR